MLVYKKQLLRPKSLGKGGNSGNGLVVITRVASKVKNSREN